MTAYRACPPPAGKENQHALAGSNADEELAIMANALGNSARVRIVRLLAHADACRCGDIVDAFPLAQPTVSQHIKVLKEAGIIRGQKVGTCVCYRIEPRAMRRLKTLLGVLWPHD